MAEKISQSKRSRKTVIKKATDDRIRRTNSHARRNIF